MSKRIPKDIARVHRMASLYKSGKTLQEIGDEYGISRERVRQLIKFVGLNAKSGGAHAKAKHRKLMRDIRRDEWALKERGCTYSQYLTLRGVPTRKFDQQRKNANRRGIDWNLTLWQWWNIWKESGKWEKRGIGQGTYCMARHGDTGAYEVGNVFICESVVNNSERPQKKSGLPRGVSKRVVGRYVGYVAHKMVDGRSRHIGTFKSPDAAHAAYLAFNG